jgi:ribosome-associated translation inhibitor RaiA
MQVPLEIAFHNVAHSDWAEREIRKHVDKLEKKFRRITACRVRVDQRARSANDTIPPVVHIELSIPGHRDVVVSQEPEDLQQRFQSPDIHNAINEAFRIAERQLLDIKTQRQRQR